MASKTGKNRFQFIVLYFVCSLFYFSSLFILLSLKNIVINYWDLLLIIAVPIVLISSSKIIVRLFKNHLDLEKLDMHTGDIFTAYIAGIAIFISILEKQ